jgi:fluoride ion exporter CrcB/FEX
MIGSTTDKREGDMTRTIESVTAAIPSGTFLAFAIGSMALSLVMMLAGRKNVATFVGQWVPTILIMGLYNKTVKQHGSD